MLKDTSRYDQARSQSMSVNVWTVNKTEAMEKLVNLGVDQITTDNPLDLRALLGQMGVAERK